MTETVNSGQEPSPERSPLLEDLRQQYVDALRIIDNEVPALIRDGHEMQAVLLLRRQKRAVSAVHEGLSVLYKAILTNKGVLKRFGSPRYARFGGDPIPTWQILEELSPGKEGSLCFLETMEAFRRVNYVKQHWAFEDIIITEIEYMFGALGVLVEPDFTGEKQA